MTILSSEEFVLQHASQPYDPAARRERYLRTRNLKGRQAAGASQAPNTPNGPKPPGGSGGGSHYQAQVAALQKRLDRLKRVLEQLVSEAKARNGIEPVNSPDPKPSTQPKEKLSGPEKREAAKKSAEYREKNPQVGQLKSLQSQISSVEAQIKTARETLKSSAKKAFTSPAAPQAVDNKRKEN